MKKMLIILFVFLSTVVFSYDLIGDMTNTSSWSDFKDQRVKTELKLYIDDYGDNHYTQLTLLGDTSSNEVGIYKAYTELYKDKLTIGIGKQKVVWGTAYAYNLTDIFNTANPLDPRAEKVGVNSLKLKYNLTDMSRIELVNFEKAGNYENYAGRVTFLLGTFEIMANYLNYMDMEDFIFEFRGDVIVGVWSQINYKKMENDEKLIAVAGIDYSFDISDRILTLLGEAMYDLDSEKGAGYINTGFGLTDEMSISVNYMFDLEFEAGVLSTKLDYVYSDNISLGVGYTYYNVLDELKEDYKIQFGMGNIPKSSSYIEVKSYF